jgi:ankyrin repeat protein
MQAAALGHALILAFLAKLGQSMSIRSTPPHGRTPLMLASVGGHATAVRCLVDLGARLDVTDRAGYTALMLAAHRGHADVAHVLLAGGADASIAIKLSVFKKLTALSLAKSGNHRAVVQLLAACADNRPIARHDSSKS